MELGGGVGVGRGGRDVDDAAPPMLGGMGISGRDAAELAFCSTPVEISVGQS